MTGGGRVLSTSLLDPEEEDENRGSNDDKPVALSWAERFDGKSCALTRQDAVNLLCVNMATKIYYGDTTRKVDLYVLAGQKSHHLSLPVTAGRYTSMKLVNMPAALSATCSARARARARLRMKEQGVTVFP